MPKKTLIINETIINRLIDRYIVENNRVTGPTSDTYLKIQSKYPEAAKEWQAVNDAQYIALKSSYDLYKTLGDKEGMKRIMKLLSDYR